MSRSEPPTEEAVTLEALIAELKVVITLGVGHPRLSKKKLPALKMVVARLCDQDAQVPEAQIEQAVKLSITCLGERYSEVAKLVFGTVEESAGLRKIDERRELAADRRRVNKEAIYRVYEPRICELIATDLLDRFRAAASEVDQATDLDTDGQDDELLPSLTTSLPTAGAVIATPQEPRTRRAQHEDEAHRTVVVLDEPTAMALDAVDRRLFVVERGKHRVVQIGLPDGSIAPVAGVGERGFSGDGSDARLARFNRPDGIAFDLDRQLLYIADTENHRVRRVHLPTGQITTVAGTGRYWPGGRDRSHMPIWPDGILQDGRPATRAKLAFPRGLALNGDGTQVFIAAPGSSSVRVLRPAEGFMRVIAGNGKVADTGDGRPPRCISLAIPARLAFDTGHKLLYVSQEASPAVRYFDVIELLHKVQTAPATDLGMRPTNRQQSFDGGLGHSGIALDQSQQRLYVNASPGIACVQLPDGPMSMVAGTDSLKSIGDILFDPTANVLYVSLRDQDRVVRIALS